MTDSSLPPLTALNPKLFETTAIARATVAASRRLAELKGVADGIPNQGVLINALALQEAKDSSAIENIVTTHDDLFRANAERGVVAPSSAGEVQRYLKALLAGHALVKKSGMLLNRHVLEVQQRIEPNKPGFRKLPGTMLRDATGAVVYTPPQGATAIAALMDDLEKFINEPARFDADSLVKMAIMHHQFESIHPFYDGNGRTGRILNVLYLVQQGLLDTPVLYLSREIARTKPEYYRLLQAVHSHAAWEPWVLYMLGAVERTAFGTVQTIRAIQRLMRDFRRRLRAAHKFYSQDLVTNLFRYPYTKIAFVAHDLGVSRLTATKYLEALVAGGFLTKLRHGRSNYYVNTALVQVLTAVEADDTQKKVQ